MEALARRRFLKAVLGVGAAAAMGLKATETLAQTAITDAAKVATGLDAAGEATESALEPTQFRRRRRVFIVRRRRRRVFFFRPRRRRVIFFRPRRRFVIVRRRRFRRF